MSTGCSYLVTHPSINHKEKGLTLLSGQNTHHCYVRVQDKVSKLTNCTNFRMIQAMIKYIKQSAVDRIEENSNDVSHNLHCQTLSSACLHRCSHGQGEMRNKKLGNRRNDITSLISPCKRKGAKGEKVGYSYGVFVFGHPSKY